MAGRQFFPFHPEQLLRTGLFVLCGGVLLVTISGWMLCSGSASFESLVKNGAAAKESAPLSFSLGLSRVTPSLPLPDVERELVFSFSPPRPDGAEQKSPLLIRLRKGAHSKRIALPSRVDLQYANGQLAFADVASPFWVELKESANRQIEGKVFVEAASGEKKEAQSFSAFAQESPVQSAQEFLEGSPFRVLAEARWWGHDLFREKYGEGAILERLEVGPAAQGELLEVEVGDWIGWHEGKWKKISCPQEAQGRPVARVALRESRALTLEGWDRSEYVRFCLGAAPPPAAKIKSEELISAIRVRSEKQISCTIEKQCLILRTGDWVFKGDRRWKVLRKPEEKEAYMSGKWVGDLFVLDRIDTKGGQKVVQGHLFNPGRSQATPVEIGANGQRKAPSQKKEMLWFHKGKGK